MYLLSREHDELLLEPFNGDSPPPYAILSHTWGAGEVTFKEVKKGRGQGKAGYKKIEFCLDQAETDGLRYCWVDTCCIDKNNAKELSKAINSMFEWYQNASKCYAYLSDVPEKSFVQSRWFTRGWTLQELLGPKTVEFFAADYSRLGDKRSLVREICGRTRIPIEALQGCKLSDFSITDRMLWIALRETEEPEDMVYSLLGIVGVTMIPNYGEGRRKAEERLHEEIRKYDLHIDHGRGIDETMMPAGEMKHEIVDRTAVVPTSLHVGFVALFNTCTQLLAESKTHGLRTQEPLVPDFEAAIRCFGDWASAIGIVNGRLVGSHDANLDDVDVVYRVEAVLQSVCEILRNGRGPVPAIKIYSQTPNNVSPSSIKLDSESVQDNESAPTEFKGAVGLGQKHTFDAQVKMFQKLLRRLIELVPPVNETSSHALSHSRFASGMAKDMGASSSAVSSTLREFQRMIRQQSLTEVDQWLQAPFTDYDHFEYCREKHLDKTCEWIFRDTNFTEWIQHTTANASRLLWIHGNPGLGKSVLCSEIVQHMKKAYPSSSVVYFFSSLAAQKGAKPQDVARSWVFQFAKEDSAFLYMIQKYQEDKRSGRKASQSDVWEILESIIRNGPEKTLILDGFDEFERTEDERAVFLRTLKDKLKASGTRLLVVSRDEGDIRGEISSETDHAQDDWVSFECRVTADKVGADITRFSQHIVDSKLSKKSLQLRSELALSMASKSEGMFLLLKLHGDSLRDTKGPKQLLNIVDKMPATLFETYERSWSAIQKKEDDERERAMSMIRWVLYAERPLTVAELADVLLVSHPSDGSAELFVDDLPEVIDDNYISAEILDCCDSLISIQDAAAPNAPASRTVGVAHFTIREFLYKVLPRPEQFDDPKLAAAYENSVLAQICVRYLDCIETWQSPPTVDYSSSHRPFVGYAATSWFFHFRPNYPFLATLCKNFLRQDNANFLSWRGQYESRRVANDEEEILARFEPSTPIYYMALFGILDALEIPLKDLGRELNHSQGRFGSPLAATCVNGHKAAFHRLIEAGADVSQEGGIHGSALNAALWSKHEDLALEILRMGPNLHTKDHKGRSTLYIASERGFKDIIIRLLQEDQDIETSDADGKTPLSIACQEGHLEIARLLLEKNADLMKTNNLGTPPFQLACSHGHLELAKMLLEKGATLATQNINGWTPLLSASYNGHLEVVRLLLEINADVTAVTKQGCTPLNAASDNGHLEVVRLLLERKADPAVATDEGWTPLCSASGHGHVEIVRLLLDRNADVAVTTNHGFTPLTIACVNGHLDTVRLLLERKADPTVATDEGWTPLNAASISGYPEIVRLLLDGNADTAVASQEGWTPLHSASDEGHLEVARLLLDNNADLTIADNDGWTPLHIASNSGRLEIVRLLLDRNAGPAVASQSGWTPLHNASEEGYLEVVRLLLDNGADPATATHDGQTPLYFASNNGHLEVVRLLLDRNADWTATDQHGQTPFYSACKEGHLDVCRLLLDRGAADITVASRYAWTPLIAATFYGRLEVVRLLLDRNADWTVAERTGNMPLYLACEKGHLEIAQLLLEKDAAEIAVTNRNGWTALNIASNKGHLEVVQLLLDKGADLTTANAKGMTPLYSACHEGHREIARLLLDKGADLDDQGTEHCSMLQAMAFGGCIEIVELLLEKGAQIDKQGGRYGNALCAASLAGHDKIVQLLIMNGADINGHGSSSGYAIQVASCAGHKKVVQLLLESHVDVSTNQRDSEYGSTLHAAAHQEDEEIVTMLLEHHADPTVEDRHGWTAEMIASVYGHKKIIDLLRQGDKDLTGDSGVDSSGRSEVGPATLISAVGSPTATVEEDGVTILSDTLTSVELAEGFQYRADHPMLFSSETFYFEVMVVSSDADDVYGVGVCTQRSARIGMPGWHEGSWAYHGDDGKLFCETLSGVGYGPKYNKGDVVGCGGDRSSGTVFFTKNGQHLGRVASNARGRLFAVIGIGSRDVRLSINFGASPFVYQPA